MLQQTGKLADASPDFVPPFNLFPSYLFVTKSNFCSLEVYYLKKPTSLGHIFEWTK